MAHPSSFAAHWHTTRTRLPLHSPGGTSTTYYRNPNTGIGTAAGGAYHTTKAFSMTDQNDINRAVQYWLDKSTIHVVPRWIGFAICLALFFLRIYLVQGYFIIAYGLGIYLLNNFILFLSPLDLEEIDDRAGPTLPTSESEGKEYRPFTRKLPEFKFWLAVTKGTITSFFMTFFAVFDVPVFWPILLMYFGILFFMTMRRQIAHMYKHKYVPISWGKAKYKNAGAEQGMFGGGMAGAKGRSE